MRRWVLPVLHRDDGKGGARDFTLTALKDADGHVMEGYLRRGEEWYPIVDGVPCFLRGALRPAFADFAARHGLHDQPGAAAQSASSQGMTCDSFSFKWSNFRSYGDAPAEQAFLFDWYHRKFGLDEGGDLAAFYARRNRVLEVGPGSGFNTRFIAQHCPGQVFAVDISEAAGVTFEKTRDLPNCAVLRADLMDMPFADGFFDFIIADGVLHHTPNTEAAVTALYQKLAPGGQFFFYVYKKMGAARQFCDEHIRSEFTRLPPEECLEACRALTELGRELSRLNATITLTRPIDVLGIPAGTHNVQRLIYYNMFKCFWNEAFDFETNNMVNFDWYHPHDAWQHTPSEVEGWLRSLGVHDYRFTDANPNGISVLLTKEAR